MKYTLKNLQIIFLKNINNTSEDFPEDISELVSAWIELAEDEFVNSPQGAKLSKVAKKYIYLIRFFCERSYNFFYDLPGNWTYYGVLNVYADLPRKLIAPKAAYQQFPRILNLFFEWAEERGVIKSAKELQAGLKS
jgi:hypothetical protein